MPPPSAPSSRRPRAPSQPPSERRALRRASVSEQLGFTSPTIQRLRRLQGRRSSRSDEGAFVAPGVEPVAGAGRVHELAPGVAERITATETPTGVLAILRSRPAGGEVLAGASLVLVADRLADPGNLGTMVRSAEACGVEAVMTTPGTVDVLNPKVVRASAGAL